MILDWVALVAALPVLLAFDLHFFARGRTPEFREGLIWSIGWLVLSLLVGLVVLALGGTRDAIDYTAVYFIERSLSLDNLVVFILLFSYFGVPEAHRARPLAVGIVAALVLRAGAILGGVALIEAVHVVVYLLGAALLVLAYRILRGVEENVDPDRNLVVRAVRRILPVTSEFREERLVVREDGRMHATPLLLCVAAVVTADIAFAVDSIPAAFAITRDPFIIWMGNVFALLGLRALFVLVASLIRRFRYLNATVAVVLALVAVKLLTEDLYEVGPGLSLLVIAVAFATGMIVSVLVDRREDQSSSSGSMPSSSSSSSSSNASSTEASRSPDGS